MYVGDGLGGGFCGGGCMPRLGLLGMVYMGGGVTAFATRPSCSDLYGDARLRLTYAAGGGGTVGAGGSGGGGRLARTPVPEYDAWFSCLCAGRDRDGAYMCAA